MKRMIVTGVLSAVICLSNPALAQKKTPDSFQQVMNYLVTGDPLNSGKGGLNKARIFDRENCVAGWEDNEGGYLKFYWNNIVLKSVTFEDKFHKGQFLKYISFEGHPHTIDVNTKNNLLFLVLISNGVEQGKSRKATVPLGPSNQFDNFRLIRALKILYADHCKSQKQKSAF